MNSGIYGYSYFLLDNRFKKYVITAIIEITINMPSIPLHIYGIFFKKFSGLNVKFITDLLVSA